MWPASLSAAIARLRRHARDPVYSNGLALVLNAGLGAGLGFVFWMAAARLFDPGALGFGAAVVSAATLAALLGKTGFDAAVVRYVPGASPRMARKILLYSLVATGTLTALLAVGVIGLTYGPASSLASLQMPAAAFGFVLLAALTSGAWILDAFFIAEQTARVTLLRNVTFQLVKLALLFATVTVLAGFAVPFAWAIGVGASFVIAFLFVPRMIRSRVEDTRVEKPSRVVVGKYAAQNYALNVAEFAPGLVLPIIVLEVLGSEANAVFYMAWTIATVGFLASKAVAQSAFAELVRDGPPAPALVKGAKLSLVVLGPFMLVLLVGAELLLGLFGPEYGASASLLRVLALSLPALVVSNHFLAFLKARRTDLELTLVPLATMAALGVALPFALLYAGTLGVGVAWLTVQSAAGVYALVRIHTSLRRSPYAPRTSLNRRPNQG